jgi:hypothetical protein
MVEVRSAAEILTTLDEQGALEALPFMPEMVAYCGGRFAVDRRTEKVCDTIQYGGSRRIHDCLLLDDVRCDGSGHDGCQAECRLYWKEAWLKSVTPGEPAADSGDNYEELLALLKAWREAHGPPQRKAGVRYRCQATEMLAASEPLSLTDPRL